MLCQNCKKNQADFHYKTSFLGQEAELHLCRECAVKLGYEGMMSGQTSDYVGVLLSNFFQGRTGGQEPGVRCPLCGAMKGDIAREGKVGCAQCYDTFSELLNPSIQRIHRGAHHTGKIPERAGGGLRAKRDIEKLREEMENEVAMQNYEAAAVLRDRIKAIEAGNPAHKA